MKKLLLINVSANSGSTGRIAEEIGQTAMQHGYESYFAYGRTGRASKSHLIRIGNDFDIKIHGIESRLFDNHGFSSRRATRKLIEEIERIKPDVINLHNLHGYYLNVEILSNYLATRQIPVVWTLHDCWPFTGHCAHFMLSKCEKWKSCCGDCPSKSSYPSSLLFDRSKSNYQRKRHLFTSVRDMIVVVPSIWMKNVAKQSFLKDYPIKTIYNGIDLKVFKPCNDRMEVLTRYNIDCDKRIILGVASVWTKQKGLNDFYLLASKLDINYKMVLVGLSDKQIEELPENIIGIKRTESVYELADLYSVADVFVNPTYVDNFPTTNIEALACGTPVVTYDTGGCSEAIGSAGAVVKKGDIDGLLMAIKQVSKTKTVYSENCRKCAECNYDKDSCFFEYVKLFDNLIENH